MAAERDTGLAVAERNSLEVENTTTIENNTAAVDSGKIIWMPRLILWLQKRVNEFAAGKSSTPLAENKSTSSLKFSSGNHTMVKRFGMGPKARQRLQFVLMDKMEFISDAMDTASSSKGVDK